MKESDEGMKLKGMKSESAFDLHEISAARGHLMGLAALWVALFHSLFLDFFQSPLLTQTHLLGLANRLQETGNCGVEIFLFLSGLGLYYSFSGAKERSGRPVWDFYRRRFTRILPSVWIVSLIHFGRTGTSGLPFWLGRMLFYGYYLPDSGLLDYWFFALLVVLYLLFPLIWRVQEKWNGRGVALMIALSVGFALLLRVLFPSYFSEKEIMFTRVPVFLLGTYFGRLSRRHVRIPRWIPFACLALSVLGLVLIPAVPWPELFLRRYAYALWATPLVISHAFLCSLVRRKTPLYRGVALIGCFSMEIYLIYEDLYWVDPPVFASPDPAGIVYAVTTFAVTLALAALLRGVLNVLRGEYRRVSAASSPVRDVPAKK